MNDQDDYFDELRQLSREELIRWAENRIADTLDEICDYEPVASEICCTNAVGWGVDEFDVLDVEIVDKHVRVSIRYQLRGRQQEDKTWFGTEIGGEATALIGPEGQLDYQDITAARDLGEPDLPPDWADGDIYRDDCPDESLITDPLETIKRYLAKHPEKLNNLTPRRFEELIASILSDLGFQTELTKATRDGGRDIYAYVRNAVTSFLMFVECKKWSQNNRVGIEIVQRVHGAAMSNGAHKSMIVTTSFFTQPAKQEHARISHQMELKDFNELEKWLSNYREP